MIDGLRQKLARSTKDQWDADQELDSEPEADEMKDILAQTTDLLGTRVSERTAQTNDVNSADYYIGIVRNAIEHGGRFNGHQIPVPWLRMIEAGLEYRRIDPEMMWEGVESELGQTKQVPAYDDMFPSSNY
jgi:hypothetical protein